MLLRYVLSCGNWFCELLLAIKSTPVMFVFYVVALISGKTSICGFFAIQKSKAAWCSGAIFNNTTLCIVSGYPRLCKLQTFMRRRKSTTRQHSRKEEVYRFVLIQIHILLTQVFVTTLEWLRNQSHPLRFLGVFLFYH